MAEGKHNSIKSAADLELEFRVDPLDERQRHQQQQQQQQQRQHQQRRHQQQQQEQQGGEVV